MLHHAWVAAVAPTDQLCPALNVEGVLVGELAPSEDLEHLCRLGEEIGGPDVQVGLVGFHQNVGGELVGGVFFAAGEGNAMAVNERMGEFVEDDKRYFTEARLCDVSWIDAARRLLDGLILLPDYLVDEFLADCDFRGVVPIGVDLAAAFERQREGAIGVDVLGELFQEGREVFGLRLEDVDLGADGVADEEEG